MSQRFLYREPTYNPVDKPVTLSETYLRIGRRHLLLPELNLTAMAEAYLRGVWLGGGGIERPLWHVGPARTVPVVRISGSVIQVHPREPLGFAQALGELAVRNSGGPDLVGWHARNAAQLGVPLWMARRPAPSPRGLIEVAVDRLTQRVDVWSVEAYSQSETDLAEDTRGPFPVRVRAPYGVVTLGRSDPAHGLRLTIGQVNAELEIAEPENIAGPRLPRTVVVRTGHHEWLLRKAGWRSSELLRDGQQIAKLRQPRRQLHARPLLDLATVEYGDCDAQDELVIHALAVTFGLGRTTGVVRLAVQNELRKGTEDIWAMPWCTGVGSCPGDSGLEAEHDGWPGQLLIGGEGRGGASGGGGDGGGGGG